MKNTIDEIIEALKARQEFYLHEKSDCYKRSDLDGANLCMSNYEYCQNAINNLIKVKPVK